MGTECTVLQVLSFNIFGEMGVSFSPPLGRMTRASRRHKLKLIQMTSPCNELGVSPVTSPSNPATSQH